VFVDVDGRRIDIKSRYEQRERAKITAREDESVAVTWYTEEEIAELLKDAGYRDVTIGEPASMVEDDAPEGERRFSVSARA
jgi:hypothetical protein